MLKLGQTVNSPLGESSLFLYFQYNAQIYFIIIEMTLEAYYKKSINRYL